MCPNCIRGLVNGELCTKCAGTGFWNPLSAKEEVHDTPSVVETDSVAGEEVAAPKAKAVSKKGKK